MTTNRLYYHDCYLTSFPVQIVDVADNGRRVYLQATAFYPTSGGQPHDTGFLGGQEVLDVVDEGERIAHVLAGPAHPTASWEARTTPQTGCALLEARIDWHRRYDHMQQHTGQHLLSAVFLKALEAQTLSFHMGTDVSSIELSIKELTDAQIDQVEKEANAIVWEARPVQIVFEDSESVQGLRKASARAGTLRVIEISGLDRSACGGTHVRSTAELGPIQVLRSEKIRGNVRVEFVCGGRALRYSKQEHRTFLELSRLASTAAAQLPAYLSGLQERLAQAEKSQQRLNAELARRDAEEAYRNILPCGDGVRRWVVEVGTIDETARAKAQAFTRLSRAVALVVAVEMPGVLMACSADSGLNAGTLLKEALARVGGRGGGSATLAQGSVPDRSVIQNLKQRLGFEASVSREPER